ncbi:G1 family glutamic endopeptidase [Sulfobacillus harzensis]|uniref:Uncharacterized protein n=1 Tax=Sulfobacillus harzensis TaxID=2729629 RepID=A0A7Y0L315_9FIRM|nr:G1 family glutamic endopeptidase [Sulfobacillus harzensis]NMP22386.1 hypothetical protein [Sulfobacillus harzensis]
MPVSRLITVAGLGALALGAYSLSSHLLPVIIQNYRTAELPRITVRTTTTGWSPNQIFPLPQQTGQDGSTGLGGPPSPAPSGTTASSYNWAGVVQEGSHETSVQASWKAPTFAQTASDPNSSVAEWIGLGGMQSSQLIQIGTITTPNRQGAATTTVFWEELPSAAVQSATVPAGTQVTAKIEPAGHGQWRLLLTAQGQAKPLIDKVISLSATQAADIQTSADWITEAPTTNSGVAPLAPVAGTTMTGVRANGVPLSKMNPASLQTVALYSQNGQLLAQPASFSGQNHITVNTVYGSLPSSGESSAPGTIQINPGSSTVPWPSNGGYGYGDGSEGYSGGMGYGYSYSWGSGGWAGNGGGWGNGGWGGFNY